MQRKDAARQSCHGDKAVKVKAWNTKRLNTKSEFSLGTGEGEVLQQKANCSNITQHSPATLVISRIYDVKCPTLQFRICERW